MALDADYDRGDPERGETGAQRLDRNWSELLQEMRVTQTGIQILFGFLLTLPFQSRFTELDQFDRGLYLVVVALVTLSTVINLTPVLAHRLTFNMRVKDDLVNLASRFTIVSLSMLGLALIGGVILIVDVAVGPAYGWIFGGVLALVIAVLWLMTPLWLRRRADDDDD